MRRYGVGLLTLLMLAGASVLIMQIRSEIRYAMLQVIRPEPPAPITPLPLRTPVPRIGLHPIITVITPAPVVPVPFVTITPSPTATFRPTETVPSASVSSATIAAANQPESEPPLPAVLAPEPAATIAAADQPESESLPPAVLASEPAATLPPEPTLPPPSAPMPPPDTLAGSLPLLEPALPAPPDAVPPPDAPVIINGREYDAYIPAALKQQQAYPYSCEFDAAWVILHTYGFEPTVDDLVAIVGVDQRIEPSIGQETAQGHIIYGGDIFNAFSGDYTSNFLARSTGAAMRRAFKPYGLAVTPVHDRPGIEAALRDGALIWMKTTVDFKPWRPAIWQLPDGRTHQTVLGNDHAVVVIGFNADVVVIRDVLGPTSSNGQRPYEYEVNWDTFMAAWQAQSFDALAVAPPTR